MDYPDNPIILELLPDFVDLFISEIDNNFSELAGDKEEFYRAGHTLKGSAAQFQLKTLSGLGQVMMAKAKNEDWSGMDELKKEIMDILYELKDEMIKRGIKE